MVEIVYVSRDLSNNISFDLVNNFTPLKTCHLQAKFFFDTFWWLHGLCPSEMAIAAGEPGIPARS